MGNNGSKGEELTGNLLTLHDWDIRRVDKGLDEAKVVAIINKLVSERDTLSKRAEHLSSLQMLAEKTIEDADELAKKIKAEAIQRAEAQAAAVLAQAEDQAENLKKESRRIQLEIKDAVDNLCKLLVSEPEGFTQRIMALQSKADSRLNQLIDAEPASTEAHKTNDDDLESSELVEHTRPVATGENVISDNSQESTKSVENTEPNETQAVQPSSSKTEQWHDTTWH